MTISRRDRRSRVGVVIALLVAGHFYVRPWIENRIAPDLLLLAMLIVAMRSRPGIGAVVGFVTGLASDVLTPARFGSGALAHTVVGYLAAWGRAVFFPDNLLVNAGLFAAATWVRTLLVLLASGASPAELAGTLLVWAPIQSVTTALAGVIVVMLFRNWLAIRLDE